MNLLTFFRHKEDVLPVVLIVLLWVLDVVVFLFVEQLSLLVLWLLLVAPLKVCVCAWNHHHQHCHTFRQLVLNRILEFIYSLHTGITTNAWVLHHNLGHHVNYLDQSKDESGWKRKDGTVMGCFEYTMTIALTGYPRAFTVGRKYPKYLPGFIGMGLFVTLVLAVGLYYKPVPTLTVFIIPMLWGYIATAWHTFYHHSGLEAGDHFEASYSITHYWYNLFTGNLGYHVAHHAKPGLHWSKLPAYHATIADKIPEHLYRKPFVPFCWLPEDPPWESATVKAPE